eukprot:evm.model.NODE_34513_length_15379_cov_20.060343.6
MGRRDLDTMVRVRGRFTKKVTTVVMEEGRDEMKNVRSSVGTIDMEEEEEGEGERGRELVDLGF